MSPFTQKEHFEVILKPTHPNLHHLSEQRNGLSGSLNATIGKQTQDQHLFTQNGQPTLKQDKTLRYTHPALFITISEIERGN